MDFAVPSGTPVKAARDGVVIRVQGNVGNAGDIIVVRHRDGSTTHYFHLSGFSVKAGQQVKQGQVIGKSGATGNVTGPHLHFEIRDSKGNKINPGKILK
jgi:murein DD-endopeptidase MepM/ murein hydrolase activator NlpD